MTGEIVREKFENIKNSFKNLRELYFQSVIYLVLLLITRRFQKHREPYWRTS